MIRIYRAALRLLPADVRERHGEQMAEVFAEQLSEAYGQGGWPASCRVLIAESMALVRFAWRERRRALAPGIDDRLLAWPERRTLLLASVAQDLRYAARLLRRSPGFTLVSVLTIALAIGANTAIFSVVHGVLLSPLSFSNPDRVVAFGHRGADNATLSTTTPGNLGDWMRGATGFEAMAGFAATERILTWDGNAERIRGGLSVGSVFDVLQRQPAEGRALVAADDQPGADPVIVLSAGLARRLYGSGMALGGSVAVNAVPHTVVGVMPADFAFLDYDYEYWIPARFDAAFRNNRDQFFLTGLARLGSAASIEQAQAQLNTILDSIRRDYPQHTQNVTAAVMPLKTMLLDGIETRLLMLMGAVSFVLLIACANLGNLMLARAAARRPEVALRQALGAMPRRLVRQILTESVLLAALGGAAGVALGAGLLRVLVATLPDNLPRIKNVDLDAAVLAFTAVISVVAGLIFGAFPALQLYGRGSVDAIRDGARGSRAQRRLRTVLVTSQLALSLILLVGAGLLVRSFGHLIEVPPGFQAERLLTFTATVPATYRTPAERSTFFERLAFELESLPGVSAVTATSTLPVAGRGTGAWFNLLERPLPPTETPPAVPYRIVRPNYFEALGIPLLRGRTLTPEDRIGGTSAVVISESVARRFWPAEDPIGRHVFLGAPENHLTPDAEIVGIVADVKQVALDEESPEAVYVPHGLAPWPTSLTFALRTSVEPAAVAGSARALVRRLDPLVPLVRVQTMDQIVARATAPARSSMVLVGLFALVALTLAIVGVFSVLSYMVAQQTTEIGIRLALGASSPNVIRLVLRQGMTPVLAGIVIGNLGALALAQFMDTLLFGITPTDPPTFVAVSLLLVGVAVLASYGPVRRAARVDPVRALRQD